MADDRAIPGQRMSVGPVNALAAGVEQLSRLSAGGGMGVFQGQGPQLWRPGRGRIWAKLSGGASPYSFVEVYGTAAGGWATLGGGVTGTSNAYAYNGVSGLTNKVVELTPDGFGNWRFTFQRHGVGSVVVGCCNPGFYPVSKRLYLTVTTVPAVVFGALSGVTITLNWLSGDLWYSSCFGNQWVSTDTPYYATCDGPIPCVPLGSVPVVGVQVWLDLGHCVAGMSLWTDNTCPSDLCHGPCQYRQIAFPENCNIPACVNFTAPPLNISGTCDDNGGSTWNWVLTS